VKIKMRRLSNWNEDPNADSDENSNGLNIKLIPGSKEDLETLDRIYPLNLNDIKDEGDLKKEYIKSIEMIAFVLLAGIWEGPILSKILKIFNVLAEIVDLI
jgi:hypothetical protein